MSTNKSQLSILSLIVPVLLVIALAAGLVLVQRSQETRRGAYFAGTKMLLQPDSVTKNVGEDVPIALYVDAEGKVDFVKAKICYGSQISLDENQLDSLITVNKDAFDTLLVAKVENSCLDMTIKSDKAAANLKSGMVKVAGIKFKAMAQGSGQLTIDKAASQVTGYNPDNTSTDMSMLIGSVAGASYVIGNGDLTGDGSVLNYRITYAGLVADANCVSDWPVEITVLANGLFKKYTDTPVLEEGTSGKFVFKGSLVLDGFTAKSGVAVFIKGPKHLQMKYGRNNQVGPYAKAGGELTLTDLPETSPWYDFSGYPVIAGDVVGVDSDDQDGWINGVDFSYVKQKSLTHETVDAGDYLQADLDGNCQVNSNDVNVLKISLNEKQGELY